MIYRRDIDGLRAVAVVPVILFHAGFKLFGGGYVGVDVFFVISGYLITSILIEELEQGNFSITHFYERRVRRILPPLFFVMLCCIPFAWMWMLPDEFKHFCQSIVAVAIFASNIFFWSEDGYFATAAELNPLLHTWSLAVEEQYYLLFPFFLSLSWRFGRKRVFWAVCMIAVISLVASEWGWRNKPSANFYLAPTRAWELLVGSISAFWLSGREQRASNWLSFAGFALIIFAIFYYDDTTPFPSVYALAPVLGTALIIVFGGTGTCIAKLLSTRGFVGIGLISYSAYLWHQPLFAFARIRSVLEPSPYLMAALAVLSLPLAYLSWRYIERPFRNYNVSILPSSRAIFTAAVSVTIAFVAGGFAGHFGDGFAQRSVGKISLGSLVERLDANRGLSIDCGGEFNSSPNCYTSKSPSVLLWGDSYAMHLVQGITASEPNIKFQQHTISSCSPILGISQFAPPKGLTLQWARKCIAFNDSVMNWLKNTKSVEIVILSSPFSGITEGEIIARNGRIYAASETAVVRSALIDTASKIRALGARVVIVSPTPSSGKDNGLCVARASLVGEIPEVCNFPLNVHTDAFSVLQSVNEQIPVYWLPSIMCNRGQCDTIRGDVFLYRDGGHLSKEGSAYLGRNFSWMEQFRAIAR
jgi:peptidoglycan/LPS O-acetylase OafA/YrhL